MSLHDPTGAKLLDMPDSNLRLIGLIVGIIGLIITFFFYRGPKWKKTNFVISALFNILLIAVCLNPNLLNSLRDFFALKEAERGRILALLIVSNIFLFFFTLYIKSKLDDSRHQFDLLVRSLGLEDIETSHDINTKIKPIMVIIPALNEAENLKCLLDNIPDKVMDYDVGVIVIDDGSDDDTYGVALESGHLVARNRINRGQGAASRLGYDILKKYGVKIGVTMDADNQHLPSDIEKLVVPILNGKYDFIVGSRILGEQHGGSFIRSTGVHVFSRIINIATGLKLTDCSSGFKAFNMDKMAEIDLREEQFQAAEVLVKVSKKGLRISEVPISVMSRRFGHSKKGTNVMYGMSFFKTILKYWWR